MVKIFIAMTLFSIVSFALAKDEKTNSVSSRNSARTKSENVNKMYADNLFPDLASESGRCGNFMNDIYEGHDKTASVDCILPGGTIPAN